jgi:hypothetical protein
MSSVDKERDVIRLYFLGQLTEEERQRLEEQFMTDRDYQEEVLIVEEDLIEAYLDDSLSNEEKESFAAHLLSTPQQRQRLEIARALDRYCAQSPTADVQVADVQLSDDHSRPPTISSTSFFRRPVVAYSVAAVLLVGIFAGAWWLFIRWRQPDFAREFALLNSRQGGSQKADLIVKLFPNTPRGDAAPKVAPHRQTDVVELQLALPPDDHRRYRVKFRGGNIPGVVSVTDLEPTVSPAGRVVPVKLRTSHLTPGDYFLELGGQTSEGVFESLADYRFRVSN